jgi:hypothetical protein
MTAHNKFASAFLTGAAFILTPSPFAQGQANSAVRMNHVDQSIVGGDIDSRTRAQLDAYDAFAIAEVEQLSRRASR